MDRFKIVYRKRKKEDRTLPEDLLLEIITRLDLSTNEVIKTTAPISKRFQHLWTRLPILVFTNEDHLTQGNTINVVNDYLTFIDKTLEKCPTDFTLTKFKLQILTGPKLQVNSWVRYAIKRNVQEIDLRITDSSEFAELDDESFFNNSCVISLKLSGCVFHPPNGAIRWGELKCLCIDRCTSLDGDLLGKILSGSPGLETLQLNDCYGLGRIDVTSKNVKNLVISYSGDSLFADYRIEINAPYIQSLTIEGNVYLEEFLLENVASLVKADLNYWVGDDFADELGRDRHDVEEELLRRLLSSLCHVNEIALGDCYCLEALSRLEAKGFQFRKGSDLISYGGLLGSYRIFSLTHES